jgi:hypothetical protein
MKFVPTKSAFRSFASMRLNRLKFVPRNSASRRFASLRIVQIVAFRRSALKRFAAMRFTSLRPERTVGAFALRAF